MCKIMFAEFGVSQYLRLDVPLLHSEISLLVGQNAITCRRRRRSPENQFQTAFDERSSEFGASEICWSNHLK